MLLRVIQVSHPLVVSSTKRSISTDQLACAVSDMFKWAMQFDQNFPDYSRTMNYLDSNHWLHHSRAEPLLCISIYARRVIHLNRSGGIVTILPPFTDSTTGFDDRGLPMVPMRFDFGPALERLGRRMTDESVSRDDRMRGFGFAETDHFREMPPCGSPAPPAVVPVAPPEFSASGNGSVLVDRLRWTTPSRLNPQSDCTIVDDVEVSMSVVD